MNTRARVVSLAVLLAAGLGAFPAAADEAFPGAHKVGGRIKPPKKIKDVRPEYPAQAKRDGIQGVIVLGCLIDEEGKVVETKPVKSIPELEEAAVEAVRQWTYEPTLLDGVPVRVAMTITVNFRLGDGGSTSQPPAGGGVTGPVRVGNGIDEPRKIKHVAPVYPEEAKRDGVQGVVLLECVLDAEGKVESVRVLRGHPALEQAAVEAVQQWAYTPTVLNGQAVPVVLTISVGFHLN